MRFYTCPLVSLSLPVASFPFMPFIFIFIVEGWLLQLSYLASLPCKSTPHCLPLHDAGLSVSTFTSFCFREEKALTSGRFCGYLTHSHYSKQLFIFLAVAMDLDHSGTSNTERRVKQKPAPLFATQKVGILDG